MLSVTVLTAGESHAMRAGSFEITPFIAVTERYTDNVFCTNTDVKSDFSTVITPGIELVFPRFKRNYHIDFLYQGDFERFNTFTSENADNHKVQGLFDVAFPVGMELHLKDLFLRTHDPRGVNISPELDFYKSNLFSASAAYSFADRFKVQADYNNYVLDYEAERNNFRNRTDNSLAGYIYYRFMPKTSAFVEYEYVITDFRESDDLDNKQYNIYGGITWEVTGKTKGTVKGGYGKTDFNDPTVEGFKSWIMGVAIDHNFTSRHSIKITGSRSMNDTNFLGANFFVTTTLSAEYLQRLTGKISAKANVGYSIDSYRGEIPRDDHTWQAGAGLVYEFKRWLLTEAGYSYTNRNSNIDDFTYENNTVFFRVTGRL